MTRSLIVHIMVLGLYSMAANSYWIDDDTSSEYFTLESMHDGKIYDLVMSDEFETPGRNFSDGYDPRWTAINHNDYTNAALHYYSNKMVTTNDGFLNISTNNEDINFKYWDDEKKTFNYMSKTYVSGMIQGWNKFCFTGGIIEIKAKLPGKVHTGGLWPAAWLMGNLARATYTSSSDYLWPWSYNVCSYETEREKNFQYQQIISTCNKVNHYSMVGGKGRGAPEIDILEAMPGLDPVSNYTVGKPYVSTSFQVSPALSDKHPDLGDYPEYGAWYETGIEYGENTSQNLYFWGSELEHDPPVRSYLTDAISANHALTTSHFDDFHTYKIEWRTGDEGILRWYIDNIFVFGLTSETLNVTKAAIPSEPMYILLNTAISSMWGFPVPCPVDSCSCDCYDARDSSCQCALPSGFSELFPAYFLIDYVRVYQDAGDPSQMTGCNPPEMPTEKWILGHAESYMDPDEDVYLLEVSRGGAACTDSDQCGNGRCILRKCECFATSTGPDCRAPIGYDDILPEETESLLPAAKLMVPSFLLGIYISMAAACMAAVYMHLSLRKAGKIYAHIDEDMSTMPLMPPPSPLASTSTNFVYGFS